MTKPTDPPQNNESNESEVDLALAIPTVKDGDEFAKLYDLGEVLLNKNLMPDQQLDIIEQIILKNWMIARTADARLAWAVEYCREFQLWKHRKVMRDGQVVQEFATFGDWLHWVYSQCTGLSRRAIDSRLAGVRIIKSLGIGPTEGVELLEDPSGIHQVARLFERDGLSQFDGFVNPEVEKRARQYIGDDGTLPAVEVAREVTRAILTDEDSVSGAVDRLLHAGEMRHKFVYEPPYLKLVVWRVGKGAPKEVRFKRVGDELDEDVSAVLKKYRR